VPTTFLSKLLAAIRMWASSANPPGGPHRRAWPSFRAGGGHGARSWTHWPPRRPT